MNDSQNDDESDLGKPVAGLGCYIGVRGLIMLILLMFIVVSSGTIIVLLTSLSPNVAEYRIWINGLFMLGIGFIIGHLITLYGMRDE